MFFLYVYTLFAYIVYICIYLICLNGELRIIVISCSIYDKCYMLPSKPLEQEGTTLKHDGETVGHDSITFHLTLKAYIKGCVIIPKGPTVRLKGLSLGYQDYYPPPPTHPLPPMLFCTSISLTYSLFSSLFPFLIFGKIHDQSSLLTLKPANFFYYIYQIIVFVRNQP